MTIADILLTFGFIYLLYQVFTAFVLLSNLEKIVKFIKEKELAESTIVEEERQTVVVQLEEVIQNGNKYILMYDRNNRFLGQGNTENEAIEVLRKKWPNASIITVNETVDKNS